MKKSFLLQTTMTLCLSILVAHYAQSATKYELTIMNSSQMPISPAAIYTKSGAESAAPVGSMPTDGFVQLCQTGNVAARFAELKTDSSVRFVTQTQSPINPGESRVVAIDVINPYQQSVHFEAMYGMSKDVCGVGSVNSHSLVALKEHVTTEVIQKDNTLLTGAFTDPMLPVGTTSLDPYLCSTALNAISCLRELSVPHTGKAQIRFFAGYFPSMITALEMKYGAADVQTLLFPTSGAIQLKLKLKH